eukprot:4874022-Pleurochrysis_carterae.AAC.1
MRATACEIGLRGRARATSKQSRPVCAHTSMHTSMRYTQPCNHACNARASAHLALQLARVRGGRVVVGEYRRHTLARRGDACRPRARRRRRLIPAEKTSTKGAWKSITREAKTRAKQ